MNLVADENIDRQRALTIIENFLTTLNRQLLNQFHLFIFGTRSNIMTPSRIVNFTRHQRGPNGIQDSMWIKMGNKEPFNQINEV